MLGYDMSHCLLKSKEGVTGGVDGGGGGRKGFLQFQAKNNNFTNISRPQASSLRSWRDFAREYFCCSSEAVNTSGEAVRGLVKSRVGFAAREFLRGLRQGGNMAALPLARSRIPPATQATQQVSASGAHL